MILLLLTFSLFFGLNLRFYPIIILLLEVIFFIYILKRYPKIKFPFLIIFFTGFGISYINFSWGGDTYSGVVIEVKDNYFIMSSKLEKLYVKDKNSDKEIGDLLKVKGDKTPIEFNHIESGFDFEDYLNKKGVYYQIDEPDISFILRTPLRFNYLKKKYLDKLNDDNADFLNTFLFGDGQEGTLAEGLNLLQLNRFLSISGIYLTAIYSFLKRVLGFIPKVDKYANKISFALICFYSIITFPKFTIMKFVVLETINLINKHKLNNQISYLGRLAISALFFILFDYHVVYSISFQLSYLIPIVVYFIRQSFVDKKSWIQGLLLSFSIFILFMPFSLMFSKSVNILSFPLQIALTPIFIANYVINFLGLFGIPIYFLSDFIYKIIEFIVSSLSFLKLEIYAPSFSNVGFVIYISLYLLFFYYYQIGFKPFYKKVCIVNLLLFLLYLYPINNTITSEVSFINVGQGDSCLIRKGSTTILVDTGGSLYRDIATECLIPYFKSKRIYDIDLVIVTHDDFDHNGALMSLCDNFRVDQVITKKEHFPLTIDGLKIENLNTNNSGDTNESSLVLYFELFKRKFLLMGDASTKVEKEIIKVNPNLDTDILKIGHHGSNTSTCKEFLQAVTPDEAIISVGQNYYGHPHYSVLKILKELDIEIKRTDILGSITYSNYIFM